VELLPGDGSLLFNVRKAIDEDDEGEQAFESAVDGQANHSKQFKSVDSLEVSEVQMRKYFLHWLMLVANHRHLSR